MNLLKDSKVELEERLGRKCSQVCVIAHEILKIFLLLSFSSFGSLDENSL